jgi:hypothetical protein
MAAPTWLFYTPGLANRPVIFRPAARSFRDELAHAMSKKTVGRL